MQLNEYYRRKRQAKAIKRLGFFMFFLLLLSAAIWGSFWTRHFRISRIDIEGADRIEIEEALRPYLASLNGFYLPEDHYVFLSLDRIKEILKEKDFGAASAAKSFPNTLLIKFEKPEPHLIWCLPDCYYIDGKGALSGRAPNFSEAPLPQIVLENSALPKLGENVISGENAANFEIWFQNLKSIGAIMTKIEFLSGGQLKIHVNEGWYIYLQENHGPQKLFNDLRLLLDQKIKENRANLEYIDLRFENKAFYKLR